FTLERRTLAEEVYPELKEYTRQRYGLELQIIDPRPLDENIPLELVNYEATFKKLCKHFCHNNVDCCPVVSVVCFDEKTFQAQFFIINLYRGRRRWLILYAIRDTNGVKRFNWY
ncbi:hypothetical protein AHF37_01965, partial [Paragonimus kellicotti]